MNYFRHKQVAWNTWSPQDIVFKSNNLVKKLVPTDNILSWTSKGDRDKKMCKRTNGKLITSKNWQGQTSTYHSCDNYKGVMVQLKDIKSEFPFANIDFIDHTQRLDSVGNQKGRLDILVYLNSFHNTYEWVSDSNGNYTKKPKGNVTPLIEGYRMCYGGQGDSNSLDFYEFHEMVQITEAIRDFLVEMVIPAQNGNVPFELVA